MMELEGWKVEGCRRRAEVDPPGFLLCHLPANRRYGRPETVTGTFGRVPTAADWYIRLDDCCAHCYK
jgi:hypothetical protein